MAEKNPAAVALGKLAIAKLTPEERKKRGDALVAWKRSLPPWERSAIARRARNRYGRKSSAWYMNTAPAAGAQPPASPPLKTALLNSEAQPAAAGAPSAVPDLEELRGLLNAMTDADIVDVYATMRARTEA